MRYAFSIDIFVMRLNMYDVHTIAFLIKVSKRLAEEYIDIYAHAKIAPSRKEELGNLLKKRMSNQ